MLNSLLAIGYDEGSPRATPLDGDECLAEAGKMRSTAGVVVLCSVCSLVVAGCGDDIKPAVTIGGSVSGMAGTGLVLRNNGGDELAIDHDGPFQFATPVVFGASYTVTVANQPSSPTQTCVVANGNGQIDADAPITSVVVTCQTGVFSVGGTVSGVTGSGLVLRNNGADDVAISADGPFTFPTAVRSGAAFAVTVENQPAGPSQTCTVSGGSGTVGAGPVTTVVVNCAVDRFTLGGTVSGLSGTVVLQNNGGDDITISSNGGFAFPTTVASGATYAVAVVTQPASPISQTCTVSAGTGTATNADITSVRVDCTTDTFTVGGTVTGLAGTGLVLRDNAGDDLTITSNGTFAFATPVASGSGYDVTVLANPSAPQQTCVVSAGAGTVGGGDVTSVVVTCTTDRFTVGGTVSGLVGGDLVLRNNGGDDLTINGNGQFTFATSVPNGQPYSVTIASGPIPAQTCTITNGSGTMPAADVTNVVVTCTSCGDGLVQSGEQCDDGNNVDNDACTNTCTRGPVFLGGTATAQIATGLTMLGEVFTASPAGTWPTPGSVGTIIISNDGYTGPMLDYTAHLNAGAHVIVIGGSNYAPYDAWIGSYVNNDAAALAMWHQSNDCVPDFAKTGSHPITQFLPAAYEFSNEATSYHMTHFPAAQPAGAVIIGNTCHGANPGILVTRRYASGGTFTYLALDPGPYANATDISSFVMPFLRGALAYQRGPH